MSGSSASCVHDHRTCSRSSTSTSQPLLASTEDVARAAQVGSVYSCRLARPMLFPMEPRLIVQNDSLCLATWDCVVIQVWSGPTTASLVGLTSRACKEMLRTKSGEASTLTVIASNAPVPDGDARAALAAFSRDVASQLAKAAVVAEGGGFRSSLVRGVGVAFTTLNPHRLPFKFFCSVEEAAAYLAPALSRTSGGAHQLIEVMGRLRGGPELRV